MIKALPARIRPAFLTVMMLASCSLGAQAAALTTTIRVVNRAGADAAIHFAVDAALRLDAPCSIAVVDSSGILVAFQSLDGVRAGSADLAIGKARAAALLRRPTAELEASTNQGRTAFVTAGFMALRGGMPLRQGDVVVGAIGIAGLNKDNDVRIATEAAAKFAQATAGDGKP